MEGSKVFINRMGFVMLLCLLSMVEGHRISAEYCDDYDQILTFGRQLKKTLNTLECYQYTVDCEGIHTPPFNITTSDDIFRRFEENATGLCNAMRKECHCVKFEKADNRRFCHVTKKACSKHYDDLRNETQRQRKNTSGQLLLPWNIEENCERKKIFTLNNVIYIMETLVKLKEEIRIMNEFVATKGKRNCHHPKWGQD